VGSSRSPEHLRIEFLDALRGIAILLVIIWHAYGPTYAEYLPFGTQFSIIPIRVFWVGVQLFFMISGFVILMTLERCESLIEFLLRRWLRLFPAMLVVSILLLGYDLATKLGPSADRTVLNLVPGLLFIHPSLIHAFTGVAIKSMDDPFWTLYVEVLFYAIFGISYFAFGAKRAITLIFSLFIISYVSGLFFHFGNGASLGGRLAAAMDWLGFSQFGWFASGALFYEHYHTKRPHFLILGILAGVGSALLVSPFTYELPDRVALISAVALIAISTISTAAQAMISNPATVFLGFVSYPLYLLHDNVTVGTTQWIGKNLSMIPSFLAPILPIGGVVIVSWVVARYIEPIIREQLRTIES
jgi:peptidoglycan/LPS O-acetylase OafA/YrhL